MTVAVIAVVMIIIIVVVAVAVVVVVVGKLENAAKVSIQIWRWNGFGKRMVDKWLCVITHPMYH